MDKCANYLKIIDNENHTHTHTWTQPFIIQNVEDEDVVEDVEDRDLNHDYFLSFNLWPKALAALLLLLLLVDLRDSLIPCRPNNKGFDWF